jgi:hypothetical protein
MEITVRRDIATQHSVTSEISVDGKRECYGLEPPYADEHTKPRCIPAGRYRVTLRFSNRFNKIMPHVENVPGFDGVEIHPGNYPKDTEACLLPGLTRADDYVGSSHFVFDVLVQAMQQAELRHDPIWITYEDAAQPKLMEVTA